MWNDEIVEEVRRVRDAYAKEHHYDIDEMFRDLKAQERESGRTVVCTPPQRPTQSEIASYNKADAA